MSHVQGGEFVRSRLIYLLNLAQRDHVADVIPIWCVHVADERAMMHNVEPGDLRILDILGQLQALAVPFLASGIYWVSARPSLYLFWDNFHDIHHFT